MPADRLLHPKCGKSHKVSMLTDLEFRVWVQYLLSSDDFGVMHATAVELQSGNLHLANRPARMILRCVDALVKGGLVHRFEHQGQPYIFSHNWQAWQKVEYPRATDNPKPTADALAICEPTTAALFEKHPGGQRKDRRRPDDAPTDSGRASQIDPKSVPPTRAGAPAERLTANGSRLPANGQRPTAAVIDVPPMDRWWAIVKADYPAHRVNDSAIANHAFVDALNGYEGGPYAAWELFQANLRANVSSDEWVRKGMIPFLLKYITEGRWKAALPASAPIAERLSKSTNVTLDAAAAILNKKPA